MELSPDHDMARYNLACALTWLGELEAARTELEILLHRDLRRFQGRWRGPEADPDLEALRASEHAPGLDALVGRLRTTYDTAHDRGIAAYLYPRKPRPAERDYSGKLVSNGSSSLVAGAWVHDARRFVPLARGGTVALLDLPGRRMIRAKVSLEEMHCHWNVYAYAELVSTDPDPTAKPKGRVHNTADGPRDENEFALPPTPELGIVDDDDSRAPDGPFPTWIDVQPQGGIFRTQSPPGYTLARERLTTPGRTEPFELDRAYDEVFVPTTADAPVFLLARRASVDRDGLDVVFDSTVVRLDVTTGETERIAHGDGDAWVVIGPDDSVYVEIEGQVQRWATPGADTREPAMPGLHLAMPVGPPTCMCCG